MQARERGRTAQRVGGTVFALALAALGVLGAAASAEAAVNRVACALPYVQSQPNFFCSDMHQVLFFADGFDSNTDTILAELLAVDEQGTVLRSTPVHAGDFVRMTSFNNTDLARVTQRNNLFTVIAPRPVLHVVAIDGVTKKKLEAYCSNVPWLQVLEPQGAVVNQSDSSVTHVRAAIPLADPAQLEIVVDGVNVLDAMVPPVANILQCTPASPCAGTVSIGGVDATVSGLSIDTAGMAPGGPA